MFFRLALRNVRRQWSNYLIYFFTVSLTVALIFSLCNFSFGSAFESLFEETNMGNEMEKGFLLLTALLCAVAAFVLGYATSFLLRRRKKEFGLMLTLGMTRTNILCIFAFETAVTFVLSLAVGIGVGLVLYQTTLLILANFLETEFFLASYSSAGLLFTVILVGCVYLISAAASLFYLRYAKIHRLLQAEQVTEKPTKHLRAWCVTAVIALVILVVSICYTASLFEDMRQFMFGTKLSIGVGLIFCALLVMFFAAFKSLVPLLLRRKKFSSKNLRTFTLRQIAGRLTSNSVMLGLLSVLLSIVMIGSNLFLCIFHAFDEADRISHPYDVVIRCDTTAPDDQTLSDICVGLNAYGKVEDSRLITLHHAYGGDVSTVGPHIGLQDGGSGEFYLSESDYNAACKMLGYDTVTLENRFVVVLQRAQPNVVQRVTQAASPDLSLKIGERTLSFSQIIDCPVRITCGGYDCDYFVVVPDEVALQIQTREIFFPVVFEHRSFNRSALEQEFYHKLYELGLALSVRGSFRSTMLEIAVPWLLIDLYLSAMFLLLSMAILALKVLSSISEETPRYRAVWKLGASERSLLTSLFVQTLAFFFLPLLPPLLFNIPFSYAASAIGISIGAVVSSSFLAKQTFTVIGLVLALYVPYFAICYLVARGDVLKSLRSHD